MEEDKLVITVDNAPSSWALVQNRETHFCNDGMVIVKETMTQGALCELCKRYCTGYIRMDYKEKRITLCRGCRKLIEDYEDNGHPNGVFLESES